MECEAEFWMLLALYVKSVSASPGEEPTQTLEEVVLPLLDRFHFLEACDDVRSLQSIIQDLQLGGLGIPFEARKDLACKLLQRALSSSADDAARDCIAFAMRLVDRSYHAIVSAISEAKSSILTVDRTMELVVEEELCRNIVEEPCLIQHVEHGDPTIEALLRRGLNSEKDEVRTQTLKLGFACALHSRTIFSKFLPIFEAALYLEDFEVREFVLAGLMDLVYMHHKELQFHEVRHYFIPSLYAPTAKLQYCGVIGCGRVLLENCFPEDTELLLSGMLERHAYSVPRSSTAESLEPVARALEVFFETYAPAHQDEMANALVYLCLEKVEAGVILVSESEAGSLQYNSSKKQEGRELQLALKLGMDAAGGEIQDAVMEGLAANLETVTKESCFSLFY